MPNKWNATGGLTSPIIILYYIIVRTGAHHKSKIRPRARVTIYKLERYKVGIRQLWNAVTIDLTRRL